MTAISESHASRDSDGLDMDIEKAVQMEDFPYADKEAQEDGEDGAESSDLEEDDDYYYASEDYSDLEEVSSISNFKNSAFWKACCHMRPATTKPGQSRQNT